MFNGKDLNPDTTLYFPFRNPEIPIAVPRVRLSRRKMHTYTLNYEGANIWKSG